MKRTICLVEILLLLLCSAALLTGCANPETKVVVRVGGIGITEDNYRYICMKNMEQYFGADKTEENLTEDERAVLLEAVKNELRRYAAIELLAQKEGIGLSSPETTQIRAEMQRQKVVFDSDEDYENELSSRYMSEHVLYVQMCNEALEEKLYDLYAKRVGAGLTVEDLRGDIEKYAYAASQIFWSSSNGERTLEKFRENIRNEEDFRNYVEMYSSDKTQRVCMVGEMVEEFEKAALSLKVGEISDVIVSSVGAHIILREELSEERIKEYSDDLREKDIIRIFRLTLEEEANSMEIVFEDGKEEMILV